MKTPVAILSLVALLGQPALAETSDKTHVVSFSELPKTDQLVILLEHSGCFDYSATEFVYRPIDTRHFDVVELRPAPSNGGKPSSRTRQPLGEIQLEPGEAQKLDALLATYRSPLPTNVIRLSHDDLTIRQLRGDRIIAEEVFRDPEDDRILPQDQRLNFQTFLAALRKAP